MPTRRPRHRRFDRVELELCWAAWETLDVALQHELLREEAADLAVPPDAPRSAANNVRKGIASLRQAADLLGHSPGQPEYRELREQNPELELAADGSIRRWLGCKSWNDCLRRALLEAVSDGDFVSPPQGDAFSERELVDAVLTFRDEHDGELPTLDQLLTWARRPEIRAKPGHRPLSWSPFARFGGYRAILERHGLTNGDLPRTSVDGRIVPSVYAYADAQLRDAVREVARRLSGRSPREAEYMRERRRILTEAAARGDFRGFPTASTLTKRFGAWPNVLAEAGLAPVAETTATPGSKTRRVPRYSKEEKFEWLRRAWRDVGEPFTEQQYEAWRQARLAEARERSEHLEIPSVSAIYAIYGSWRAACDEALPGRTPHRHVDGH